jgi:hypothetical protein
MNTETGELLYNTDPHFAQLLKENLLAEVIEGDMTEKQFTTMQVSKFDNKSKLGKKFLKCRCDNGSKRKKKKRSRR